MRLDSRISGLNDVPELTSSHGSLNTDNDVISSFHREGNSCSRAGKYPVNMMSQAMENTPNSGSASKRDWFPTVIFDRRSNANCRTGSMAFLLQSQSPSLLFSDLSVPEHHHPPDGVDTELDSVACPALFGSASESRVGRSQNRAPRFCRELPPEITTISKRIMDLYSILEISELELVVSYFTKRLGGCNVSSTLFYSTMRSLTLPLPTESNW